MSFGYPQNTRNQKPKNTKIFLKLNAIERSQTEVCATFALSMDGCKFFGVASHNRSRGQAGSRLFSSVSLCGQTGGTTVEKMSLILKLMRFAEKISWRTVVREVWIHVGVGILLLGLGTFLVETDGTVAFRHLMPFAILLSFPAGLAGFLVAWPFVDISPAVDFSILWLVTFVAGYFQWFHVVPNLRSRGLVTLSLSKVVPPPIAVEPDRIVEPVSKPKAMKAREPRVIHFDAAGRTPLERAIWFTAQKRATRSK